MTKNVRTLTAQFMRELRAIPTPALTMKQRNAAIRSHAAQFAKRHAADMERAQC
jgi:hypothetical protein